MKTTIFRKLMPTAVFVLGISGAFLTTSMQSADKVDKLSPEWGFVDMHNDDKPCDIAVPCNTAEGEACLLFETFGPQAFGQDPLSETTCNVVLSRPQ